MGNDLASLLEGAAKGGEVQDGSVDPSGGTGAASGGDGGAGSDGDVQLRQDVARQKEQLQKALPFVQFVQHLSGSEVGKEIMTRWQKGEDYADLLTKAEKQAVKDSVEATEGISIGQLKELLTENKKETLEEMTNYITADRHAASQNEALEKWAKDKLPGFEKIRGSRQFSGNVDAILGAVRNGTMEVPKGATDLQQWQLVYEQAYNLLKVQNPDLMKGTKKPAASEPEKRAAEILAQSGASATSSEILESKDKLPPEYKAKLDFIQSLGSGTIGKSFSGKGKK